MQSTAMLSIPRFSLPFLLMTISNALLKLGWCNMHREHAYVRKMTFTNMATMRNIEGQTERVQDRYLNQFVTEVN
jgi:hypothetical protein